MNIFVFGTLMYEDVLRALLGRVPDSDEATLRGFRRAYIHMPGRDAKGPAIEPRLSAEVRGRVLLNLTDHEIAILDLFETAAGGYERVHGDVIVSGSTTAADFYVADSTLRPFLTEQDWSESEFEREHLASYVNERIPTLLARWRNQGLISQGENG